MFIVHLDNLLWNNFSNILAVSLLDFLPLTCRNSYNRSVFESFFFFLTDSIANLSPSSDLPFHCLLMVFFWWREVLNFNAVQFISLYLMFRVISLFWFEVFLPSLRSWKWSLVLFFFMLPFRRFFFYYHHHYYCYYFYLPFIFRPVI